MGRFFIISLLTGGFVFLAAGAARSADDKGVESVLVIGTAPADVQTVGAADVSGSHALTATDLLNASVLSVFLSDTESSPFQEALYFRGFDASPVPGTPEGLAVYQDGTRDQLSGGR
jgi:hypothetical protein